MSVHVLLRRLERAGGKVSRRLRTCHGREADQVDHLGGPDLYHGPGAFDPDYPGCAGSPPRLERRRP